MYQEAVFPSLDLLLAALADLGYPRERVELGRDLPLYGYRGDRREETADVVIRRRWLDRASNDLGFARTAAGYAPVVSEYDAGYLRGRHGEDFVVALRKAYNRGVIAAVRRRLRGSLRPAVREGQTTKIILRF
ncbi:MAG TPA: hypothetical protein VFW96_01955 [Thermomicrobiales bacterium]|nr:hypothetical protein [Thermomicrobiales bacterium]